MGMSQFPRQGADTVAVLWMGGVVVDLVFLLGLLNDLNEAE